MTVSVLAGPAPKLDVLNVPREAERLLGIVTDPRQRAILENFRRHAMLEVAGRWPEILAPDLTCAHPVYRVVNGTTTEVYDGHEAVAGFYRGMTEAGMNLIMPLNLTEHMAVADWGLAFESDLAHVVPGPALPLLGVSADGLDLDATYVLVERVANLWPYDEDAKLLGENVYIDVASRRLYRLEPADVLTPARARLALEPLLAAVTPAH
jgi:hypothetical protein